MTLSPAGGILEPVNAARNILPAALLALSAHGAPPPGPEPRQTNEQQAVTRTYDARIQMHNTPLVPRVPTSEGKEPSLTEALGLTDESSDMGTGPRQAPRDARAAVRKKDKDKNRNWILPSSSDTSGKARSEFEDEEDDENGEDSSGWGWLADDIRSRQEKKEAEAEAEDKESTAAEAAPRASSDTSAAVEPWIGGMREDSRYAPVSPATRSGNAGPGGRGGAGPAAGTVLPQTASLLPKPNVSLPVVPAASSYSLPAMRPGASSAGGLESSGWGGFSSGAGVSPAGGYGSGAAVPSPAGFSLPQAVPPTQPSTPWSTTTP